MKEMRIAFTGPSGSGKTTLVKYVTEKYGIPWLNGSSGGLDQGRGHAAIIRSGHINPIAAGYNQRTILDGRAKLMWDNDNWVTDRSPIDNIVYMLLQCSMYEEERWCYKFVNDARMVLQRVTHLVWVRPLNFVEDNKSRVANIYFQDMVDGIFAKVMNDAEEEHILPMTIELKNEGKEERFKKLDEFLTQ